MNEDRRAHQQRIELVEDRRAHERLDVLEAVVAKNHDEFEADLAKNTRLTQEIADNTSELVAIFRGAKGMRAFMLWVWPFLLAVVVMVVGAIAYIKGGGGT